MTCLEAALALFDKGRVPLPLEHIVEGKCSCGEPDCTGPGKHPTILDWSNARPTRDEIGRWWEKDPDANVGMLCGRASGIVVLDIDTRSGGIDSFNRLSGVPKTRIVKTGGNGWHYYFAYPNNGSTVRSRLKIPGYPGLEVKSDGSQVVVPPSLHISGNRYAWDNSLPLAPWPMSLIPDERKEPLGPLPDSIPEGERHNTLLAYAGALKSYNLSPKAILAALRVMNEEICIPPHYDADLIRIAQSAAAWAPNPKRIAEIQEKAKPPATGPFQTLDLERLAVEGIPKKSWLLPGWVATDDIAVFAGTGGIGKSTTAAALAVALAQGMPWCGLTPTGCGDKVLWFDEEQGDNETARTFIRLGGHNTSNLQVCSSVGLNLKDEATVARLTAHIQTWGPAIVFLDSAQQCFGIKDENSAVEVGEVFRALFRLRSQYGVAIFIVHHKRKSSGNSTQDDIELVRGSSAFTTQASMVCLASKGPEDLTLDLKMTKRRGGKKLTMRVRYFEESEDGPIHLTSDGTVFRSDNDLCREWIVDFVSERPEVKRALLVVAAKVHGYSDNRVDRCLEQLLVDNVLSKHPGAVYTVRGRLPKDPGN